MNKFTAKAKKNNLTEQIRRQYLFTGENTMDKLRELDAKVKTPAAVISSLTGISGALLMGGGIVTMISANVPFGIALGMVGVFVTLAAYPLYYSITEFRKKKYAYEIMSLSSRIIGR